MSTRGVIARATSDGFKGRYHHFDSYPDALGSTLWKLYHGYFKKDIRRMTEVLIDEHPAGWSSINEADFNLPVGYWENRAPSVGTPEYEEYRRHPQCYCHGDRNEKPWDVDQDTDCGAEFVYIFDEGPCIRILSTYTGWGEIGVVNLNDDDEPNWLAMLPED